MDSGTLKTADLMVLKKLVLGETMNVLLLHYALQYNLCQIL